MVNAYSHPNKFYTQIENIWLINGLGKILNQHNEEKRNVVVMALSDGCTKEECYEQWVDFPITPDGKNYMKSTHKSHCICSKSGEKNLYFLENEKTKHVICVGSTCLKLFGAIDEDGWGKSDYPSDSSNDDEDDDDYQPSSEEEE